MKGYMYILTNPERSVYMVGSCTDLEKALKFYNDLPTISPDPKYKVLKMVYCEGLLSQQEASERFKEVTSMTKKEKEILITSCNPDFIELILGVNFKFQ